MEISDDEAQRSRITIVWATAFEIFIHILLTVLKTVQKKKCFDWIPYLKTSDSNTWLVGRMLPSQKRQDNDLVGL